MLGKYVRTYVYLTHDLARRIFQDILRESIIAFFIDIFIMSYHSYVYITLVHYSEQQATSILSKL